MLTTRAANRDKVSFLNLDLRLDLLDDDRPIALLVYERKPRRGTLTLDGQTFTMARSSGQQDERLYQALFRVATGAGKPPVNPYLLKDESGQILALAERHKSAFTVSHENNRFILRKSSLLSPLYHFYRQDNDQPQGNHAEDSQALGSVGQRKLLSQTMQIDLPKTFDLAFQVFLLVLLLDYSLDSSTSSD
jgi:hypothetical protein